MNLPRFSVKFPVTVAMLMLAVVILGVISLDRLGTDLLPSIYNPRIVVELQSGQRSPQDMEQRFARQLEGALGTVSNVVEVHSVCRIGRILVTATFSWGTDMDFALLDVQKKIATYESDPEVNSVTIARYDPQEEPIMIYALAGNSDSKDEDEMRRIAENVVQRNLERLEGVARVRIYGGLKQEVRVELDEYLLKAYTLTPENIVNKIQTSNVDAAGGRLIQQETAYIIKGIGKYTTINEIRATVVGYKDAGNGAAPDSGSVGLQQSGNLYSSDKVPIFLSDVAKVSFEPQERTDMVMFNGQTSIGLYVFKESRDNTVRVAGQVHDEIAAMAREMTDLKFSLVYSQADFIENAVSEVKNTAIAGIILAILVLYAFLRHLGATLIVSLAIPISILATFTLMYFQNLTLNIMTLGGLALGAGMLVDNAIVVIENTFRRRQLGEDATDAAVSGASEVGVAIIASTLTTIIVFLPIVYVRGIAAELFKEQAWVVAFSLLSSLFIAFTLIPTLAAKLFARRLPEFQKKAVRLPFYERFLDWALEHRVHVVITAVALLTLSVILIPVVGSEFVPRSSENQVQIQVELPAGTPLQRTISVINAIENRIEDLISESVNHIYSTVNVQASQNVLFGAEQRSEHRAQLILDLATGNDVLSPAQAIDLLRAGIDIPGIIMHYNVRESSLQQTIGSEKAPISIEISGDDFTTLKNTSARLAEAIKTIQGLHTVETSFQRGLPEINLRVNRTLAASFGLDVQQIGRIVQQRLTGQIASDFFAEGNDRDIRVAFELMDRSDLENMQLETSTGAVLKLTDIVTLVPNEGPQEIQRRNQSRIAHVTAQMQEGIKLSSAVGSVQNLLNEFPLPSGYQVTFTGEEASRQESFDQMKFALILSVILVYMVLASLFESLLHPLTIMLTLPLAGIGVVFAFLLVGEPLSVMAYIGIIMLAGIAANDSIVLVDYINRLRNNGMAVREAVRQAGRDRLRPILMTSATTILALLPMTIGIGEGARLRAPMAIAVIGGLITSTILTLVVIPVVYEIFEGLKTRRTN